MRGNGVMEEEGVGVFGAKVEGASKDEGASDLFPLALCGPLKVTERSSRFQ